jgi:hypothetical protein
LILLSVVDGMTLLSRIDAYTEDRTLPREDLPPDSRVPVADAAPFDARPEVISRAFGTLAVG